VTGTILQINVSRGGLPKRAISHGVVTPTGLEADAHAHPGIHGGPRKALLLITAEGIDELIAQGYPVFYGALGENLTTQGLERRQLRVGQRFRAGQVTIELTAVRAPCDALEIYNQPGRAPIQQAIYDAQVKAGDASSPRWGLSGFYASILQTGVIRQNDIITLAGQVV
jgi:MOSC domain-containing protein YiiM